MCIASSLSTPGARVVYLLPLMNLHWLTHHHHPKFTKFKLLFALGLVYFMGLDKCIKICIHFCGIYSDIKIISVSSILLPYPQPLATTNLFSSHRFAFSRMSYSGLIQYVNFLDSLLSCSNIALNFPPCLFMPWFHFFLALYGAVIFQRQIYIISLNEVKNVYNFKENLLIFHKYFLKWIGQDKL